MSIEPRPSLLAFFKAWVSRLRWALKYGARWSKVLICVNRGYHKWNVVSSLGPIPPTVCITCRANYTVEWHEEKKRLSRGAS